MVAFSAAVEARTVRSMPTVKSVEEALQYIDAFKGDADNCRFGIPEQLFDPAGVSAARITDRALSRGWEPDGFVVVLDYRVYRFRAIGSQPNKSLQPIARTNRIPARALALR